MFVFLENFHYLCNMKLICNYIKIFLPIAQTYLLCNSVGHCQRCEWICGGAREEDEKDNSHIIKEDRLRQVASKISPMKNH